MENSELGARDPRSIQHVAYSRQIQHTDTAYSMQIQHTTYSIQHIAYSIQHRAYSI